MGEFIHSLLVFFEGLGYWGVMLGLMVEVIPSEIVLSYAGYLVAKGEIGIAGAVIFGTIGGVIAQLFVYWVGRYGGRPILEKFGKYILINKHHIDVAENWFTKYGTGVIFTARFIPVVRHAISVPAGMARMPLGIFTLYTTLAIIPWSILFVYLGITLKDNWEHIDEIAGTYTLPLVFAAIGLLAVYLAFTKSRSKRSRV
ncbi:DedA family protein [Paenibacillus lutrae]|uniref:DedA family protein n=1 Tax=Paenibacillus lutrae TaxID=2078573 RepID=A0A7X3FLI7_9BACL|nr:DedA family protein [Paenibacillus lutrae]MVP01994.1 DedA family protein [Paenibacillus lutrae]